MQDETMMAIALVIAGFVAYFCRNLNWGSVARRKKFIEKASRDGYCTVGHYHTSKVIRGIRESDNSVLRDDSLKVKYRYTVNGITYYKHLTFMNNGKISADFPCEVKVYYDPKNPKKAVCPNEATKGMLVRSGCMTSMFIFILTLTCAFYLLRMLFSLLPTR